MHNEAGYTRTNGNDFYCQDISTSLPLNAENAISRVSRHMNMLVKDVNVKLSLDHELLHCTMVNVVGVIHF